MSHQNTLTKTFRNAKVNFIFISYSALKLFSLWESPPIISVYGLCLYYIYILPLCSSHLKPKILISMCLEALLVFYI